MGFQTKDEGDKVRIPLVGALAQTDFSWQTIVLDGGAKIDVSYPMLKGGYFLPVTAQEQWDLARKFKLFPLTRAVADQAFNAATYVPPHPQYPYLFDFEKQTEYLKTTVYFSGYGTTFAAGAHKLWLLSNMKGNGAVNYGFYVDPKNALADQSGGGKYLDRKKWLVIQSLGGRHDPSHWDYSQLLQLMGNYRTADGGALDLRAALLRGDTGLWDEGGKLAEKQLPF
jgi:hypothetical protein